MNESKNKKVLADVNGFSILSDTIYEIVGKDDKSAPQAFRDANIVKAPFEGNDDWIVCPYDSLANVYDTGFYSRSRCYARMDQDDVKRTLDDRINNIMRPYEDFRQVDMSQTNFDFWDNASEAIYMGKIFNTADPVDTLFLYIGVHSGMITPKEMDGDPFYMHSKFCIVEKNVAKDFIQQREINKMNLSYKFISALTKGGKSRQSVIDLLLYIGIITRPDLKEDDYYTGSLSNWMNNKKTNIDYLLDVWDRSEDDGFKEVLQYNRIINILQKRGKIRSSNEGLLYNGQLLGPDAKASAEHITTNKAMVETKLALLSEYEELIAMDSMMAVNGKAPKAKVADVKKYEKPSVDKPLVDKPSSGNPSDDKLPAEKSSPEKPKE